MNLEVKTVTPECWKTCALFEVFIERYKGLDGVTIRGAHCKHLTHCEQIMRSLKSER